MDEQIRYTHDRATVMQIIKYALFVAIAVGVAYLGSRVVVIILPFLLGFVLAKASRHLSNLLIRIGHFLRRFFAGRKGKSGSATEDPDTAETVETGTGDASSESGTSSKFTRKTREKHPIRKALSFIFPSLAKRPRPFKTRLTLVVFAVLVVITLGSLTWALVALIGQLNTVIKNIPQWIGSGSLMERIEEAISNFSATNGGFISDEMTASAIAYLKDLLPTLENRIPAIASSLLMGLVSFVGSLPIIMFFGVVIVMSGVYFITDGKKLLRFFARNIKNRVFRHKSFMLLDQLSTTLFRVLGGYLALLIITFFEALAVFYLIGIKYAVILALITAVLDFMPVLGVSATMVPLMIYLIIQGNYVGFLILLVGMTIITIVRRVIEPPILGNAMNMHPLATLFAMIIGVAVWGAIGFLVGPVVLLILLEVLKVFSFDKKLRNFMGRVLKTIED